MKQLPRYLSALFLARTMITAVGCASTASKESTGEYIDDSVITTKVKAAILKQPTLKVAEINVENIKGIVQLSGFDSTKPAETTAVEEALAVGGVKSVTNSMQVK